MKRSKLKITNYKTKIFDAELFEWFNVKTSKYFTIQDENLKKRALEMAENYKIKDFVALNGYVLSFKKRHNITSKIICGESKLVGDEFILSFRAQYKLKLDYKNNTKAWMSINEYDGLFNINEPSIDIDYIPYDIELNDISDIISPDESHEDIKENIISLPNENNNILSNIPLTFLNAFCTLETIESFFIQNIPHKIEQIYELKKIKLRYLCALNLLRQENKTKQLNSLVKFRITICDYCKKEMPYMNDCLITVTSFSKIAQVIIPLNFKCCNISCCTNVLLNSVV
ncbi:hypothetical protein A3Q56_04501 [Intoshia linei]|uniref:HTH CENPB-type domain-containing protein n=1 Tax=Intoshia linei TaxID=1819745 RepID=A0A177B0K8_9BILA|nr:hypothetical protein A3Q56_04501 [Intoshia linei]